jgi:hypothetical protein
MIDRSMSPAVRRSLGLEPILSKSPKSDNKESLIAKNDNNLPTIYEELHRSLTGKFHLSPAPCRRPDDLCLGCPDAGMCG